MKIRKTLTTLALACLLTATLAAPALAADPTIVSPATTAGSAVNAAVDNAYTVTSPEKVDFGKLTKDSTGDALIKDLTVSAAGVVIPADKNLNVTVKGDGTSEAFTIDTAAGGIIGYNVYNTVDTTGTGVTTGGTFKDFEAGKPSTTQTVNGKVKLKNAPVHSGDYTGTLTFTCTVAAPTP